jgi:hypothetical protein
VSEPIVCPRCATFVADAERHEDFCSRVNDVLPFRPCGHRADPGFAIVPFESGGYLAPCHARLGHSGFHIHDAHRDGIWVATESVRPTRWWRRR